MRECAQQLLCQWLASDAGGSVPGLLSLLDVQCHEDACSQVVRHFYPSAKGAHGHTCASGSPYGLQAAMSSML